MKEMLYEVRCLKSNEDMILALAGQFKKLSHEPEKFRWLNRMGSNPVESLITLHPHPAPSSSPFIHAPRLVSKAACSIASNAYWFNVWSRTKIRARKQRIKTTFSWPQIKQVHKLYFLVVVVISPRSSFSFVVKWEVINSLRLLFQNQSDM